MSVYGVNSTFANVLGQPSQWSRTTNNTSLTAIVIALSIAILSAKFFRSSSEDKIQKLGGFQVCNAWTFFTKRYDFLREHFKKTGVKMFRFNLLQHRMLAMAGNDNRKIFFNDRNLELGYGILLGSLPKLGDINVDMDPSDDLAGFIKRLLLLLRKERVTEALPLLFDDINNMMKAFGTEGKMNPFNEVYDLVFQMTVRMATCRELCEDKEAVRLLAKCYWDLENSSSPVSVLLPWLPTPAKRAKKRATAGLYNTLSSYVNLRRKASTPSMDPIDIFISEGISNDEIVGTIISIVFAGVANTGVNSCWALLHLGLNIEWKQKAINEYKSLVEKHTNTTSLDPLHKRLSLIPLEAWENELPSVDLIIRETLRLSASSTLLRRNVGKDIHAVEGIIKRDDFLAYSVADVHFDPDIYSDPMTFDPARFGPGREEDRKEPLAYLAWGAGRHPCAGMKIAKLELKVILAMFLVGYEYEVIDSNGNQPKKVPEQDRNDLLQARPIGDLCYLKFKRVVE